ncbi:MAG: molybdopterin-dependent oxidoreductase, partial [Dehalococcoidia bacterium]|nr:molybdopterin-dependent oxidoreductase [Dehalococcoidia bacterium]
CDKGNRCQLRQIATDMGIGLVELQRLPQMAAIEEVNPFIERDLSKCILCGKCIRACQEMVVEGAIDYFQRGFFTKPATYGDFPLESSECTFCGTCVALCSTGALAEKEKTYHGTTKTAVETTCPYCGCGCSISLEVKDGQVIRVTPGKEDRVNQGTLCVRGSYGYDFVCSPDRLTKPLVRTKDGLKEVSWEEALERAASGLKRIKEKYGPDSLAVLGSPRCTNEENYLLQRFARCVLGTNNTDNGSRLYTSATEAVPALSHRRDYLDTLEQSDVIMVIGADPSSSAPIMEYAIKRAVRFKGASLILVDPRRTKLASFAHLWLRPRVGSDVALLDGLARVIIDEDLLDKDFVARRTNNLEELARALDKYSPEDTEAITGIPAETIRAAARLYAGAGRASVVYGSGITQYPSGTDSIKALANLVLLTGNAKASGGGVYPIMRESNARGAGEMGVLPDFLPGYQSMADAGARRRFEERWGVSLPAKPGLTAVEIIEQAKKEGIKGLYVVGENPVLSFPHSRLVSEVLTSLDFLIVQDIFLSATAELATVVLPAASFAEKEGTFTNFEGRVNRIRKAIEPIGESLPDWEIVRRLAERMGYPLPFSSPQQIMDEVEELVPHQAELEGPLHFSPVEYAPLPDGAKEDYPFVLLTGTTLHHQGTGSRSSRARRLVKFSPQPFLEIGAPDAIKVAVTNGDRARIISPTGEVSATVRITDTLPEGMLFMPVSFPEAPVNGLFDIALDTEAKTPALKSCYVKVEKVGPDE